MNLTEIREALDALGVRPAKGLGQNFLHDRNLSRWIVEQLGPDDGTPMVEIGPGLGALTDHLALRGGSLLAIEKDGRLVAWLRQRFTADRMRILEMDATDFDTRSLFPGGPVDIVANLPYSVTSPVLFRFASAHCPVRQILVMVQKELAERLVARPHTSEYGGLTLVLGRRWQVELLKTVPPESFLPRPRVDSGIVRLSLRPPGEVAPCDPAAFEAMVRLGFSQRRKQLHKLMKPQVSDWDALCAALGVPRTVRAEELDLHQWIELVRLTQGYGGDNASGVPAEIFDVVNENDEVTGRKSRCEVHVNNLRHRAVHILLTNGRGELWLQKRSHLKDRHPSVWDSSASGHVDAGESYDEAAIREVREELGIETRIQFHSKVDACEATGWEFVHIYTGRYDSRMRIAPEEIDFVCPFPVPLLQEWIGGRPGDFAPGFLECFRRFVKPEMTGCCFL